MHRLPSTSLIAFCLVVAPAAQAAIVNVSDANSLQDAIQSAQPGDEIVLESATYSLTGANCSADGTAAAPIIVRAAQPLGAVIEFDGPEGFKVSGAHWRFEGLDIVGVCANDSDCEHAFHVFGPAHGFWLSHSRVRDFNAQLKVNAFNEVAPDDGLIEGCDIGDTSGRQTSNPVTKLNIDGGLRWIVRDNYLHDFHKDGGNTISFGAFMKSGGGDGVFERNLVLCTSDDNANGARIGLSFGGGGTAPQYCAPAYDANVPCDVEHSGGIMRNNIIANCSDVGIYLNRASNTKLLFNTLVGTTGVDFRFATSSGLAHGNVVSGPIRDRDGASHSVGPNLLDVAQGTFDAWYTDPLHGDLSVVGDVSALTGQGSTHADVTDDYCARQRPGSAPALGALEHSLGSCDTFPPPGAAGAGGGAAGAAGAGGSTGGAAGAGGSTGGAAGTGGTGGDGGSAGMGGGSTGGNAGGSGAAGIGGGGPSGSDSGDEADGCACRMTSKGCNVAGEGFGAALGLLLLGLGTVARRKRDLIR